MIYPKADLLCSAPDDIIESVLEYLDDKTILKTAQVSRIWKQNSILKNERPKSVYRLQQSIERKYPLFLRSLFQSNADLSIHQLPVTNLLRSHDPWSNFKLKQKTINRFNPIMRGKDKNYDSYILFSIEKQVGYEWTNKQLLIISDFNFPRDFSKERLRAHFKTGGKENSTLTTSVSIFFIANLLMGLDSSYRISNGYIPPRLACLPPAIREEKAVFRKEVLITIGLTSIMALTSIFCAVLMRNEP